MNWVKYLLLFLGNFLFVYIFYFVVVYLPQVKQIKDKNKTKKKGKQKIKRERKLPSDLLLLAGLYRIDIEKVGVIRMLKALNFVNALVISLLVTAVFPIPYNWLKLLILAVLVLPTIYLTYCFLGRHFLKIERMNENV